MIGDGLESRVVALGGVAPFDRLEADELRLIARHARLRAFEAGHVLIPAGAVAEVMFVQLSGAALTEGTPAPAVFDAPGLLFGLAARADHVAGPEGLVALLIAKPHVFTLARECPEFVVGLRDQGAAR